LLLEQLIIIPALLEHSMLSDILALMGKNEVKRLVQWLQELFFEVDEDEYQSVLAQKISHSKYPADLINVVSSILFQSEKHSIDDEKAEKLLSDLSIKLKREQLRGEREALKERQKQCDSSEEEIKIMGQIQSIQQQLNELKIS
jgi:hypothetical protein